MYKRQAIGTAKQGIACKDNALIRQIEAAGACGMSRCEQHLPPGSQKLQLLSVMEKHIRMKAGLRASESSGHIKLCIGQHIFLCLICIDLYPECPEPVSYTHLDVYKRQP